MKIYNTLKREKEEFVPITPGKVTIYSCGPTVYNYFHIGNARPFIMFDTLRRYLKYRGYDVTFVQNFTDIDDKLINKANEEGTTVKDVAERFIKEYFKDAKALGIMKADIHPRATENIADIIDMVSELLDKGFAYARNGDVYFRARKFNEYGKLSNFPLEELESGARVSVSKEKEDPMDFALWKAAKPGEPFWESPFGNGRPGWHIECSVMANKYLGKTIDIHCGGQDLIFPHHENEIAQSECANGAPFARYWMHNGFININNQKMSKSAGNFFTVRDAAEVYGYDVIRFFMLSAHYRSPINYSPDILESAKASLERIANCFDNLEFLRKSASQDINEDFSDTVSRFLSYKDRFIEKMDDDLNTADAISVIFDLIRDINTELISKSCASVNLIEAGYSVLKELCDVLGLIIKNDDDNLDEDIETLIEERQTARKNRDFKRADEIRDKLKGMGIELQDTPQGVKWKRI